MTTSLATLRSLVRERGHFMSGDPMFPDSVIDRQINVALSGLQSADPIGWWWNHIEVSQQNTTGVDQEYIAAEPATAFLYDVKAQHVQDVFVSLDGDFWTPIAYRTTDDATILTGGRVTSDGLPVAWSALQGQGIDPAMLDYNGVVIRFAPPLPAGAWVRYITTVTGRDLVNPGDGVQGWPDIWMDAVVETAAAALIRQRKQLGSLNRRAQLSLQKAHQQAADEWVKSLRRYATRGYEGPANGTLTGGG